MKSLISILSSVQEELGLIFLSEKTKPKQQNTPSYEGESVKVPVGGGLYILGKERKI